MNNTKRTIQKYTKFPTKETFERSTCRLFKASSTKLKKMWKKYNMKMKKIDYQASQLIALQVGARLGLLASLVGICDEGIKMGYVDSSLPPFKLILETSISCMVYKNV
jgi:hypothetical protein